jgi:hypothetical protein
MSMTTRRINLHYVAMIAIALTNMATADDLSVDWYTVDGGGGTSTGGDYVLSGTVGQPDAGMVATGGDFTLAGGFWPGGPLAGPALPGDCNGDGVVDAADFALFDPCLLGPGNVLGVDCDCFDLDADGDNDLRDFASFQTAFTGPLP